MPGLFPIRRTGVSVRPLVEAALAFIVSLSAEQKSRALFPIDSDACVGGATFIPS
jgi:hypothetical protein